MKRILVIRLHRLGDVLQLTPMLAGLKAQHPEAAITLATGDNLVELMHDQPYIDEIVSIPESQYRFELKNKPERRAHIYHELYDGLAALKERRFDLAINRQYEEGALMAYLIDAGEIRGGAFSPEREFYFADQPAAELFDFVKKDRRKNRRNLVDWASLIAGVRPGGFDMSIRLAASDRWEAADLLAQNGVASGDDPVAVQMGAARTFRHWGAENHVRLLQDLILRRKRKVILLGTREEKPLVDAVKAQLPPDIQGLIDLTGKTSLRVLGGVLERCRLLITGDTGTMHLATAVGTRVLALFYGTAFPWETGPYGNGHLILYADEPCAPCGRPEDCPLSQRCRNAITPEHVLTAFDIADSPRDGAAIDLKRAFDGRVRLFMTQIESGTGQSLAPIDDEALRQYSTTQSPQPAAADVLAEHLNRLERYKSDLLHDYCLGDREALTQTFSRHIVQWLKLMEYLNKTCPERALLEALGADLMPVIEQAAQALQDSDFALISDMVRSQFPRHMDRVAQIAHTHEEMKG